MTRLNYNSEERHINQFITLTEKDHRRCHWGKIKNKSDNLVIASLNSEQQDVNSQKSNGYGSNVRHKIQ